LEPAICEALSECCRCGGYFTIVRKPTKWNAFGEFKDFSKNRTVEGVGSICIFPPRLRDVETYLPRFIPDGKGGQVDRCKREPHYSPHGQTEVIGLVFFRQRLCYVSMIVGREAQSQVAEIMRENKAPDARILKRYDGTKSGSIGKGYKLDGIVWLTMSDTIGEGMYTGGECLVIYDEKIMAKITKEAER
jgi:hypothetical protein